MSYFVFHYKIRGVAICKHIKKINIHSYFTDLFIFQKIRNLWDTLYDKITKILQNGRFTNDSPLIDVYVIYGIKSYRKSNIKLFATNKLFIG